MNTERIAAALATIVLSVSSLTAAPPPKAPANRVAVAKELIRGLYPELRDRSLRVEVRDVDGLDSDDTFAEFLIVLRKPLPKEDDCLCLPVRQPSPKITYEESEKVFYSYFAFGVGENAPWIFRTRSLVDRQRLEDLRRTLKQHRSARHPSLEQMNAAYDRVWKDAGVRFGPHDSEAFRHQLPLKTLEKVFGKIRITRVELVNTSGEFEPEWMVDFEAQRPGGKMIEYWLSAEPFEGKVSNISGTGSEPPFRAR